MNNLLIVNNKIYKNKNVQKIFKIKKKIKSIILKKEENNLTKNGK